MADSFDNGLNPAQVELISHLAEEASELIKACMKTLRHGIDSPNPKKGTTNRADLNEEASDVYHLMVRAGRNGLLDLNSVLPMDVDKAVSRQQYIHHEENKA